MIPDLNPVEHLWKELKHAVWRRQPSNLRQLEQFAHEEWAKIPVDRCRSLTESYINHLITVIASKGCTTTHYFTLFLPYQVLAYSVLAGGTADVN